MRANQRKSNPPPKSKVAEYVTIIAGALAMQKSITATAYTLSPLIGVPVGVLRAVLSIAMSRSIRYTVTVLPSASATSAASSQEATYRAFYVWNATQRIMAAPDRAKAIEAEKVYFNQHMDAVSKRRGAANAVDKARAKYGDELGWYAVMDNRTSPECREANGKNFNATHIPSIGFPGAVHPNCRCRPGKAFATSQTVYGIKMKVA